MAIPDTRQEAPTLLVPPADDRQRLQPNASLPGTDIPTDPVRPLHAVHPAVIGLAASGVVVFLLATGFFYSSDPASDLNLLGVAGFAVIFFTLTLGLAWRTAREPRWGGNGTTHADESLEDFAEDNVPIATGTISGREAMVQILILPATLAAGMVAIGLIYAIGW